MRRGATNALRRRKKPREGGVRPDAGRNERVCGGQTRSLKFKLSKLALCSAARASTCGFGARRIRRVHAQKLRPAPASADKVTTRSGGARHAIRNTNAATAIAKSIGSRTALVQTGL
jgi:hypothetical protein